MPGRNVLSYMMGLFGRGQGQAQAASPAPRRAGRSTLPPVLASRPADPDAMNPATITHVGRAPDGRDLVRTQGLGSYLVDRETPTICYFLQGNVAEIPTVELRHLFACLMEKRDFHDFTPHYVDLLNVASFELQARSGRIQRPTSGPKGRPAPAKPLPRTPVARHSQAMWPDAENPATITRVGRSQGGAELVMTLGLGTFVVYRDPARLRYFDRGREWDVPAGELRILVEALHAKQDTASYQASYVDLLNVATAMQQNPPRPRRH